MTLDTGASKTVIGKDNFEVFVSQLPGHVQKQIKRADSQVVFRFGNNGVLPSMGSAYVPYGKKWLKIEIVRGKTPFLLSNAGMRQMRGQFNFDTNTLWTPQLGKGINLTLNNQGLFLIDIRELLGLVPDFETALETRHEVSPENAAVRFQPSPQHPPGVDPLRGAPHGDIRRPLGSGISSRGGRGPEPHVCGPSSDHETGRDQLTASVGKLCPGRWPLQGKDLLGHDRQPSRVRAPYHQSSGDGKVSREFPEPLSSSGEREGAEEDEGKTVKPDNEMTQGPILPKAAPKGANSSSKRQSQSFHAPKAAGSAELRNFSNQESILERVDSPGEKGLSSDQMAMITGQLDELCSMCEASLKDMAWSQPHVSTSQSVPAKACAELFEVSCGFSAFLSCGEPVSEGRQQAKVARPGIRDPLVRSSILEKVTKLRPRHLWLSLGFKNLSKEETRVMMEWCQDLYFVQIIQGNHFHIWTPKILFDCWKKMIRK